MYAIGLFPDSPVYQNMSNWRIEGQVENLDPSVDASIFEIDSRISIRFNDNYLTLTGLRNETPSIKLKNITSLRFVAQRNSVTENYTLEVWDEKTGDYSKASFPFNSGGGLDCCGGGQTRFAIGTFYRTPSLNAHLGFLRVYSSLRTIGGSPPPFVTTSPGDLLNFEFEGSMADTSPQHLSVNITGPAPSFIVTPAQPPAIAFGISPQTLRTGQSFTLDASGAFSNIDSPALTYAWTQVSGPGAGSWSSANTVTPTFLAPQFGTYLLRLNVHDSLGQSATREIKIGAVETDNNGVVSNISNEALRTILGPQIRFGANPWSWADNRNQYLADGIVNSIDTLWPEPWLTPSAGKLTVTQGSYDVYGSSETAFLSTICDDPNQTKNIVVWYPSTDYPGTWGRGFYTVKSCVDDHHLILNLWGGYQHPVNGQPLQYTILPYSDQGFTNYFGISGVTTVNYYDNVLGLYSLYFRSGLDQYLVAARSLADRVWASPLLDRGMAVKVWASSPEARKFALLGMMVRAADGKPEMWKGLRHFWDFYNYHLSTKPTAHDAISDQREMGFSLSFLGGCALLAPDADSKTLCLNTLRDIADRSLAGRMRPGAPYASLNAFFGSISSATGIGKDLLVRVVHGSPIVTLVSGTGIFNRILELQYASQYTIWFGNFGSSLPASNAEGDSRAYNFTVDSPTQIRLTTNYGSGATVAYQDLKCAPPNGCTKGWSVTNLNGYGVLVYMAGELSTGLDISRQAMEANGDSAHAMLYKQWALETARWLATVARNPDSAGGGLYTAVDFVNCTPVGTDVPLGSKTMCLDAGSSRYWAAQVLFALSRAYSLSHDPVIKAAGDAYYTQNFAKPGWNSPFPGDGKYMTYLDDGQYMVTRDANEMLTSFDLNKYFGFFFGFGNLGSWPAVSQAWAKEPSSPSNLRIIQ